MPGGSGHRSLLGGVAIGLALAGAQERAEAHSVLGGQERAARGEQRLVGVRHATPRRVAPRVGELDLCRLRAGFAARAADLAAGGCAAAPTDRLGGLPDQREPHLTARLRVTLLRRYGLPLPEGDHVAVGVGDPALASGGVLRVAGLLDRVPGGGEPLGGRGQVVDVQVDEQGQLDGDPGGG